MDLATGTVAFFDDTAGWGVIDSEETPGGCFVFFDAIVAPKDRFRSLSSGEVVRFKYECVTQDGYSYRAVEVWRSNQGAAQTAG